MLLWCVKSQNLLNEWSLITRSDLAFRIQESLELNLSGILLRSQNQLRDKFQQEGWLYESLEDMTDQQRRDFLRRILIMNYYVIVQKLIYYFFKKFIVITS